jgi:hypothetical protein
VIVIEQEILARYSTPGLRRNQLSRWAKRMHLLGFVPDWRAEEILADLYPERNTAAKEEDCKMEDGLKRALQEAGGVDQLAALLHVSPAAVAQWYRVPAERVMQVEKIIGIPRKELRPDLFPQPKDD